MFRDALLDMNSHPQLEVTPDSVTPWLDYYDRNLVGDEELLATTGAALSPGMVGGGWWAVDGGRRAGRTVTFAVPLGVFGGGDHLTLNIAFDCSNTNVFLK